MPRTMLTDKRWEKLLQIMKNTGRVYNKSEHRMTFEGILFRMRTGIPWRDLPEEFGEWSTVYRRFNLWSKKGILVDIFKHLSQLADFEWVFLDSSIIRAHQHSTGAATEHCEQIGQSCGGNSTKIHLAVDSGGLPICFELSEGQRHDITYAENLVEMLDEVNTVIADKGYGREPFRCFVRQKGGRTVIAKRNYGKNINKSSMDRCLYRYRHLVENAFARINQYRSISTRYDKLERNYASMVSLAFMLMWLPMYC
ncbi:MULTISPECIES: IS5 family transposase [unclassified Gilliamella]|uniref:IS5 family transposase n=3 Tax=Gilliamella TaxID=1193503 RepID=UPI00080E75A8|nr:IS5 family transposase [Gilliamella apicola]OCG37486.1 transposase [Gilliamella apicola]OCG48400.1 transposase [Gilliamella apicola]